MTAHDRREDRTEQPGGRAKSTAKSQSRGGEKDRREKIENRPKVLARLPDLDISELDRVVDADPPTGEKRPLTQRLSTLALIGVGALFIMVAVQPYMGRGQHGGQPPAPSAPAAPAWDATANTTPAIPSQQVQAAPSIPVSIPALPPSIPSVPESIQGPAAPSANPSGLPVPSFNRHSQTAPAESISAPGLAEASSASATKAVAPAVSLPTTAASAMPSDNRTAQLATPPSPNPSTPYAAPAMGGYQPAPTQPGYYGAASQAVPNQALALQPNASTPSYPSYAPPASTAGSSAPAFAGAANTGASLNATPTAEPGVARLQGVIEKSTQRPSYDSSRPSLR